MDEEAVILIQAINSIKTIIKHEPSSHDKVSFFTNSADLHILQFLVNCYHFLAIN